MKKTSALILFLLLFFSFQIAAAPASRDIRTYELPDGTSISYTVIGDERYHYVLSTDGYVLMKNDAGFYAYAQKDERNFLVAGNVIARNEGNRTSEEIRFLQTITPFMEYHPDQIAQFPRMVERESSLGRSSFSIFSDEKINLNAQKHKKNIVILVEFNDLHFTVENPREKFLDLLNKEGYDYNGATGSVRDYFIESSFGAFQPSFDVVGPYQLNNPMSHYTSDAGNRAMIREACHAADVNFQEYSTDGYFVDNVSIIFAGHNAAEGAHGTIWPHYSNKLNVSLDDRVITTYICTSELRGSPPQTEICGIGTFVHEFSHILGLPDLYNTQSGTYSLDKWSVMDGGLYLNRGRTPSAYSSYERFFMGWLVPEILDSPVANVNLPNLIDNNKAYILADGTPDLNGYNPTPNEFFMIENRQLKGFDAYLPYHGMLIWRIHYNKSAWESIPSSVNTNSREWVYLVRANGLTVNTQVAERGNPFPGTTGETSYSPTLLNGTDLGKPIYCIDEKNGIISFNLIDSDCIASVNSTSHDAINVWSSNNTLYISGIEEKTQVEIWQIDGKIAVEKELIDSYSEIYIPKAGLYIVRLKSKNVSSAYKIILQ